MDGLKDLTKLVSDLTQAFKNLRKRVKGIENKDADLKEIITGQHLRITCLEDSTSRIHQRIGEMEEQARAERVRAGWNDDELMPGWKNLGES